MANFQRVTPAGVAHQLDHLQERHHHHHVDNDDAINNDGVANSDGAVHYDTSKESLEHTDKHGHCGMQLLFRPAGALFTPFQVPLATGMEPLVSTPHPYLDGPQRPPSFAPGLAAGG